METKINNKLELINEWLKLHKLSLNIKKDQVHNISHTYFTINEHLKWKDCIYKISNAEIHEHRPRAQHQLCTIKPQHEYARYCIRYSNSHNHKQYTKLDSIKHHHTSL